jgi:folate-binding protein YgfZ
MSPYEAAQTGVAFRRRRERGVLRVTGADRIEWLNNLLTNDLKQSAEPRACHAAWLTPQGRMVTDVIVVETGFETWLDVPAPLAASLAEQLDRLIFAEDARVADASGELASLGYYGPVARAILIAALVESGRRDAIDDPSVVAVDARRQTLHTHAVGSGRSGVHVYAPAETVGELEQALTQAGKAVSLDDETEAILRVEAGVPAFLVDMNTDTIPLEAGLDDTISHTKGCYVGQEIIVRIRDRAHGRVARKLVGLTLPGHVVPPVPQGVTSDGRQAGRITSAVPSTAIGHPIALATLLRDFTEPGTSVVLEDGTPAVVTALPFVG